MSPKGSDMAEARPDSLGAIMSAIGAEGATIVGRDSHGLYIYAELDGGVVSAGVFKDEGEAVRYFDFTDELAELLPRAWRDESSDEAKRWAVMEYAVRDSAFHTQFKFPGQLDPNEDTTDRRRAALKARYGDKPIIYPPMPDFTPEMRSE